MTDARIEKNRKIYDFIQKQDKDFYVSWLDLSTYNLFDLPYDKSKEYNLGWLAGSPFNKTKIEKYTGDRNSGIYSIYNKEISWYFTNNIFYEIGYDKKVINFYLSNYENCIFNKYVHPITDRDTVYELVFYIPME